MVLTKRLGSAFHVALLDEVAGSFRQDQHTDSKDKTPCELHSNRDTISTAIVAILCSVVDNGSNQKTNGNGKLVASYHSTTNPLGKSFRLTSNATY